VAVDDDAAVPRLFLWLFSLAERNKDQKMPARQQQWPTTIIIANGNNKLSLRQKRNTKMCGKSERESFSHDDRNNSNNNNNNNKGATRLENKIKHTHTHEERLSQKAAQSQSFGC